MKSDPQIYTGTRKIGDHRFIVHIPATGWEQAEHLFKAIDATLDGTLVEEQQLNLCAVCRGTISKDFTNPEPVNDSDWPDEISD